MKEYENFNSNSINPIVLENTDSDTKEDNVPIFNKEDAECENEALKDLREKGKKNVYLASSVLCTLATGAVGVGVVVQKQNDDSEKIEPASIEKIDIEEDISKSDKVKMAEPVAVMEASSEPKTEEELKNAIEIAKARSIESQNSAPSQPEQNIQGEEEKNLEIYSYNLEEQLNPQPKPPEVTVGQSMTSNNVANAMRYWNFFEYYGYTYGIDPYLLVAMASQESRGDHQSTIPGGKYYNGAGYGIMQIEKPGIVTKKITAYNHTTKSYDIMYINSEQDVYDVGLNIKAGAMQLAQKAKEQQYNPYVTIQGYNYGTSGVKYALSYYIANGDINRVEEIYGSGRGEHLIYYIAINNSDWVNMPTASGLTAREWYSTEGWKKFGAGRGDKEYIEHVMRYYRGIGRPYILKDTGERIEF